MHDPTTLNRQGYDTGSHYRSVIFYHNEKDKNVALEVLNLVNESNLYQNEIVTEVEPFTTFYAAEDYHQDYYDKKYKGGQGPICHWVRGE